MAHEPFSDLVVVDSLIYYTTGGFILFGKFPEVVYV
jgi:hypothetical protein